MNNIWQISASLRFQCLIAAKVTYQIFLFVCCSCSHFYIILPASQVLTEKMHQWIPILALRYWVGDPFGEQFLLSSLLIQFRQENLSKSQDMWQPLSFFQILWAQNLMWSPPFYHWPWHHRIFTTTLPLKLGNCLLSRSLEEFAYWFWSCYLVTIQSVMERPHLPNPVLCALFYTAGCNFACVICKHLFPACPHLYMPFLVPNAIMLYQFTLLKSLVMWFCQVCLIFLFI